MKVRSGSIFALVLLLLFAGGLYLCKEWSMKARLFPLLIVVTGIGLSAWVLRSEISAARSPEKREGPPKEDDRRAALRADKRKATPKSEGMMILWMLALLGMILVFGYWVAIAVFTPFFMSLFGRENWKTVAIYTAGIWLGIYLTFAVGMHVSLYGGILGLSW
jgi:hypothetical protein